MHKFETRRKRTKWIEETNPIKERRKKGMEKAGRQEI